MVLFARSNLCCQVICFLLLSLFTDTGSYVILKLLTPETSNVVLDLLREWSLFTGSKVTSHLLGTTNSWNNGADSRMAQAEAERGVGKAGGAEVALQRCEIPDRLRAAIPSEVPGTEVAVRELSRLAEVAAEGALVERDTSKDADV